ncbi:MAG: ligand-binding sensor domain-containing protein, partial [Bacteroidia bacterium]
MVHRNFKNKKWQRVFIAFIFLFCFTSIGAQNFRNFLSLTGKKDVSVNCILQADDGVLWIGTAAGLVEYNGEISKLYTEKEGICNNNVTALFMQSDHTIWIGHKNGQVTLMRNKKFLPFEFNDKLPNVPVYAFCEASGIWIASYGNGISFYTKDKQLKQFDTDKGLGDNSIYTLCSDGKTNVWAGTDQGITHIDIKNSRPSFSVVSMKEGLPDNIVRSLLYNHDDNLLVVAMQDSGVCRYDIASNKFKNISHNWRYGSITSIYPDKSGSVLLGTQQHGVIRYFIDAQGKEFITVIDSKNGLADNAVNTVFADREDNLWLGTDKSLSEMCQSRISYLTGKTGLISDKVLSFYIDKNNNHWIGTDKGLLKYSYSANGQVSMSNYLPAEGKPARQVTCIHEDGKGILWLGTYGEGLYRLDPETGKQENIAMKNGLADNDISSITEDLNNNIWIATLGGGISRINETRGKREIKNYSAAEGLTADYIYSVYADSKNNLWIGTDGDGLIRYTDGVFVNESKKNNIKGKTVYSITGDHFHNIWFSVAEEGIYKYDGNTVKNYSTKNGLKDNNPMVLEAIDDAIITAHPRGIDVFNSSDGLFSYFPVSDNDIEPSLNASFKDKEGNAWIGTNAGVIKFRAYNVSSDVVTPLVKLSNLVVQYQLYSPDSAKQFSYRQNNFVFNFSAVWLRSAEKIKFRYKLKGLDSTYFETETKAAYYSNLPAGNYTFLVSAANNEGIWSNPVRYSFSIATPLWQKVWFWLLAIILTITAFYFLVLYRVKALQREKNILEHKVNIRTTEILEQTKVIEAKNKELERLSIVARETDNVIIIMDAQGRLEWINESFERLNNIKLDELKKLKGETIFDVSNNPDIRSIVDRCIREKKSIVYESKNKLKDGRFVWESSTMTPIYNEKGVLNKLVIIDTDVTERKRDEDIIRQKNKDITDSINYAKKIQNSILPGLDIIKKSLPESFVLFMQKDIVSGDFYWFSHKDDDTIIIAAVDCTGHGVPGAFMSL